MNKPDLSIIIPFASEFPQAIFTVQSIAQSILNKINFEIIVVDNHCEELETQWKTAKEKVIVQLLKAVENKVNPEELFSIFDQLPAAMNTKCSDAFQASSKGLEWLKYIKYDGRLSHWECKRLACSQAQADTFLFIDAHCIPSLGIDKMFLQYNAFYRDKGTFHMPLTYKILEWRKLIYKMVVENNFYGYSFTGFRTDDKPYEVPCMSTCGMMISREIYDKLGGWPKGMYAYGGGENYMNYGLAVIGAKKYIYPNVTLHHHGEKRDYHYTYDGTLFNRLLAHYLFGGSKKLTNLMNSSKGKPVVLLEMGERIRKEYEDHRYIMKKNTVVDLDEWVNNWRENGL